MRSEIDISTLQNNLDYRFRDEDLLWRAITRKPYAKEKGDRKELCDHQEALCVLGDAVLKALLTETLIRNGYDTKGEITRKREARENGRHLAKLAIKLGIVNCVRTNEGDKKIGADKQPRVLAETLEAIVGAIFLDSDYDRTREVVLSWSSI